MYLKKRQFPKGECENDGSQVGQGLLRKSEFLREAPESLLDMKEGKSNDNSLGKNHPRLGEIGGIGLNLYSF